jgi:hypothetical protein
MLFLAFSLLQVMDALTTLVFLQHGVAEANPLVAAALAGSAHPIVALVCPKLFAMMLGFYAWRSGRRPLLVKMNVLFGVFVAWNLVAIALSSGPAAG